MLGGISDTYIYGALLMIGVLKKLDVLFIKNCFICINDKHFVRICTSGLVTHPFFFLIVYKWWVS